MKNLLIACLPALALFALGGCAGTSALTSSEDDGVYYSSKDHTTAIVSAPTAPAITEEAANPDYNVRTNSPAARQSSGSDQYYDNTYTYMRGAPSYTPPLGYYTPYSPYTSLGYGGGAYGFSPYSYGGFSDPFYGLFGSPYGYGSGLSISFGFGRSFGYGGGYGSPFGYNGYGGYGGYGGFNDPYFYGGPFYGGYYGRSGYYGNSYGGGYSGNYGGGYGGNYGGGYGGNHGGGNYSYGNGYTGAENGNGRTYGHRTDRSSEGRYNAGSGGVATPGTTGTATGGGRVRSERIMTAPGTPSQPMPAGDFEGRRTRNEGVTATPGRMPANTDGISNQSQGGDTRQPRYRNMDPMAGRNNSQPNSGTAPDQGQLMRDGSRGRYAEAAPQNNGQAQPQTQQNATPQGDNRNRGGFFQNVFSQPGNPNAGQTAQPQQRSDEQSQQRQQRSYEQPQRSYEQPQRSYSQPSYGGSNSGGNGGGNRSGGNRSGGGSNGGGGGGNSRGRGN